MVPVIAAVRGAAVGFGWSLALAMAKQMFAASMAPSLEQFLDMEILMQPQLTRTLDYAEGTNAFKEKRKAVFVGR